MNQTPAQDVKTGRGTSLRRKRFPDVLPADHEVVKALDVELGPDAGAAYERFVRGLDRDDPRELLVEHVATHLPRSRCGRRRPRMVPDV